MRPDGNSDGGVLVIAALAEALHVDDAVILSLPMDADLANTQPSVDSLALLQVLTLLEEQADILLPDELVGNLRVVSVASLTQLVSTVRRTSGRAH